MDDTIDSVEGVKKDSSFKFRPIYIAIAVLIVIVAVGVSFFLKQNKNSSVTTDTSSGTPATTDPTTKSITLAEVANHKDATSCWMAIEGNVYDVTGFVPQHPGEEAILMGCGKDATEMFNTRPNDGTTHSNRARQMLARFAIGVLSN